MANSNSSQTSTEVTQNVSLIEKIKNFCEDYPILSTPVKLGVISVKMKNRLNTIITNECEVEENFFEIIELIKEPGSYSLVVKYICDKFPQPVLLYLEDLILLANTMHVSFPETIHSILEEAAPHFQESSLKILRKYSQDDNSNINHRYLTTKLHLTYIRRMVLNGDEIESFEGDLKAYRVLLKNQASPTIKRLFEMVNTIENNYGENFADNQGPSQSVFD